MFNYVMSATGQLFHESDKFVKMLCGPYGSGKSCCCAMDCLIYACAQAPDAHGVRYSRVGVIRATYNELVGMTRKSLMEVLPPESGTITGAIGQPPRGNYIIPLIDGTTVNMELNLFALNNADDCHKILSANWTFAWINEATGVANEVFSAVMTRVGRFPPQDLGGVSWGGIIMDFNQPEQGSWLDRYMKNPEHNWGVFRQPPAAFKIEDDLGQIRYEVNADAENLRNLGSPEEGDPEGFTAEERGQRYYRNQINTLLKSGREDVVQNQYCMLDVPVVDGKPVYTSFNRARHVATKPMTPHPFIPIVVGMDQSGIHPACVILQQQEDRWCVLDEIYADGEGLETFLYQLLVPMLRNYYATNPVVVSIDPSDKRDDWQGITPSARLRDLGLTVVVPRTNVPKLRILAVERMLNITAGGLFISPECELLVRGFVHEYRYRRLRASGTMGAAYTPIPDKNDASHVHDALQYAALYIFQGEEESAIDVSSFAKTLANKRRTLSRVV